MSDVATKAHVSTTGINNGSAVTYTSVTGEYEAMHPWVSGVGVNQFMTSGEMFARWDTRLDSYWYYAGSGAEV